MEKESTFAEALQRDSRETGCFYGCPAEAEREWEDAGGTWLWSGRAERRSIF
jgi:hypothetical protein